MTAPLLANLIERATGLAIDRGGVSTMLDRFVADRMRSLGHTSIESYAALAGSSGPEQQALIDAITVPHTWFYRDPEQLRTIEHLMAAAPPGPLAIWVAGCATGEEAYTLAMIARRIERQVSVVATDVNETVLKAAQRGVYSALAVRDVPEDDRRWLAQRDGKFVVDFTLRSGVSFARHNLVDPPPPAPRGAWDLIVCRNVLIYFAPTPASRLLARFARAVREGGWLVVGASEVVFEPPPGLELVSSDSRLVLHRPPRHLATVLPRPKLRGMPPTVPPLIDPAIGPAIAPTIAPATAAGIPREPVRMSAGDTAARTPVKPVNPDDLVSALGRGHGLFEQGEILAAIEAYDQLARAHPSIAEVWLFLGIAHYAHGNAEAAASALRASLCLDATMWPAGFYLARAYERLGRRADALQQYDLIAVAELPPLTLQSSSAVINELRALRHDVRNAARRLTAERTARARRLLK